jgi:parallel beta-helix repeat protein
VQCVITASLNRTSIAGGDGESFTYYVDFANGSDANAGTQARPWKSIAKVNSTTLMPGQSVGFKRGGTWRETLRPGQSGEARSPITFGAYGSGARPVITGSDLIAAGWSQTSANIWKSPVMTRPFVVYVDGRLGNLVSSQMDIASQYDWFWTAHMLYVWSPSHSDPSGYYRHPGIEAGSRANAMTTNDRSFITVNGITLRDGNGMAQGTVNVGSMSVIGIEFRNCIVERGSGNGFNLKGATTATNITIDRCTIQNNGGHGISIQHQYSAGTLSNNIVTGNGWRSVPDNNEYDGISGRLGNISIAGNTIYGNAKACNNGGLVGDFCHAIYYSIAGTTVSSIFNNTIYGNTNGSAVKTRGSADIYHNILYANNPSGIEAAGNGPINIIVLIHDNKVYLNGIIEPATAGIVEDSKGTGSLELSILHNIIYHNSKLSGVEIAVNDSITTLTIKNNIIYTTPMGRTISLVTQIGSASIDNNVHWRADGNPNISFKGSVTWPRWRALGYDSHGSNSDPLFTNPGAGDFALLPGSPAVDAGFYIRGSSSANEPNIEVK